MAYKETRFLTVACIPCYNEAKALAEVVIRARPHVDRIIVCDDGSTDLTGDIAEALGCRVIRHPTNLGKGGAMKSLFLEARNLGADIAVTLDGDGQHDPGEIPSLVKPIEDGTADVVNGSRTLGREAMPGHRKVGNAMLDRLTNAAASSDITDSQSGYRAYSKKALSQIEVIEHGIGVDSQILMSAFQKGLRVAEVPVTTKYGEGTSTYHPAKHGLSVVVTILRVVIERSPLLLLGLPGLVLSGAGAVFFAEALTLYNNEKYFSLPFTLLGVGFVLVGLLMVIASMILYALANLRVRLMG